MRYPIQKELLLNKPADATPQEVKHWEQTDYFRKGDFDPIKLFVIVPTLIQVSAVGFMFLIFYINSLLF